VGRERRIDVGKILLVLRVGQLRGKILDHHFLRFARPVLASNCDSPHVVNELYAASPEEQRKKTASSAYISTGSSPWGKGFG
jgi:hypothetical protein